MIAAQHDRITIDPTVLVGKPTIRGLRISVGQILRALSAGVPEAELLADYPDLELEESRRNSSFLAERGLIPEAVGEFAELVSFFISLLAVPLELFRVGFHEFRNLYRHAGLVIQRGGTDLVEDAPLDEVGFFEIRRRRCGRAMP